VSAAPPALDNRAAPGGPEAIASVFRGYDIEASLVEYREAGEAVEVTVTSWAWDGRFVMRFVGTRDPGRGLLRVRNVLDPKDRAEFRVRAAGERRYIGRYDWSGGLVADEVELKRVQ
jgi:hypothetical protein